MSIYEQWSAAFERSQAAHATHKQVEHLHYCALKHLRDCIKNGFDTEEAIKQADLVEKKVFEAFQKSRKAADEAALIANQMKTEAA